MQARDGQFASHTWEGVRDDIGLAFRAIRRRSGFSLLTILTVAFGIGVNAAAFSVVRGVLLKPLPYQSPSKLYRLYAISRNPNDEGETLSAGELVTFANESRTVASLTFFGNYAVSTYVDGRSAQSWRTAAVAPNFFQFLGVRPLLGRTFTDQDVVRGARPVVVLTHAAWLRAFGGDRSIVEREIELDGRIFTVVGVLPPSFVAPTFSADAIRPLNINGYLRSPELVGLRLWRGVARLREEASRSALETELPTLRQRVQAQYPAIKNAGISRAVPLKRAIAGAAEPVLWLSMAGAVIVLLVTCVTVAGLTLSRAAARERQMAIRAALGAERARLVRQLLAESIIHGVAGGVLGIALAFAVLRWFVVIAASRLPRVHEIQIDVTVLCVAAATSIFCGALFGILPALSATRFDLRRVLDDGSKGDSISGISLRRGALLVSSQFALATVLLVSSGLLLRTFLSLLFTSPGYSTTGHVLTFHVDLPPSSYRDAVARMGFLDEFTRRVRAIPQVQSVAYTAVGPWNGTWRQVGVVTEGNAPDLTGAPRIDYGTASEDYFATLEIPVVAGRAFDSGDRLSSPPVAVVSESVARRLWSGKNPIGLRLRVEGTDSALTRTVVGVVGDVSPSVMGDVNPMIYLPEGQVPGFGGEFVVRTTANEFTLIPTIETVLRDLNGLIPMRSPTTVRAILRDSLSGQLVALSLIGGFACLAILLAGLGLYSTAAHAVARRKREFAIRAALGASASNILRIAVRESLLTSVLGIAFGLVASAILAQAMSSLVARVSTHDPIAFTFAPLLLVALALCATWLPAQAAIRTQPADALRAE